MLHTIKFPAAIYLSLAILVCTGALTPAFAQDTSPESSITKDTDKDTIKPPIEEQAQPKKGSVSIAGHSIEYTATPGTLTIRNDKGEPIASMFYVAYTSGEKKRPVTFLFNGGPGSSSLWLHMGSFGPVRVETPTDKATGPAPYAVVPNNFSLLDKSDLVFIDAMGTGYSRPLGKAQGKDFWGVDQDIKIFADAITRYLTLNNRWNSPKFIFGESYGTTRAAGLSLALQERGANPNGIILLSSYLNMAADLQGNDLTYVEYLPSYAATAWYHNKLTSRPATLELFLKEVRNFASGPYLTALAKGDTLENNEKEAVAEKLATYTGLSKSYILKSKLRIDLGRFTKELMRDEGKIVGRFDARFTGEDADTAGEAPGYDAAEAAISGAYIASVNSYISGTLGYKTGLKYRPNFYREIGAAWDMKHNAPDGGYGPMSTANTALDLAAAMRQDPHLKVLSLNGYYDMATPFFGTEYDLNHMRLDTDRRKNLSFAYYESGHMVYIRPEALEKLKADLTKFYDQSTH